MLEKGLDGTQRPWRAEPLGATEPLQVLAPIAYVRKANASLRLKDTSYVYIYRKVMRSKAEL